MLKSVPTYRNAPSDVRRCASEAVVPMGHPSTVPLLVALVAKQWAHYSAWTFSLKSLALGSPMINLPDDKHHLANSFKC